MSTNTVTLKKAYFNEPMFEACTLFKKVGPKTYRGPHNAVVTKTHKGWQMNQGTGILAFDTFIEAVGAVLVPVKR